MADNMNGSGSSSAAPPQQQQQQRDCSQRPCRRKQWSLHHNTGCDGRRGSLRHLRASLADDGCCQSQLVLARQLLESGVGESAAARRANSSRAVLYLVRASWQGSAEATELLRECVATGVGVTDQNYIDVCECLDTPLHEKRTRNAARQLFHRLADGQQFVTSDQIRSRLRVAALRRRRLREAAAAGGGVAAAGGGGGDGGGGGRLPGEPANVDVWDDLLADHHSSDEESHSVGGANGGGSSNNNSSSSGTRCDRIMSFFRRVRGEKLSEADLVAAAADLSRGDFPAIGRLLCPSDEDGDELVVEAAAGVAMVPPRPAEEAAGAGSVLWPVLGGERRGGARAAVAGSSAWTRLSRQLCIALTSSVDCVLVTAGTAATRLCSAAFSVPLLPQLLTLLLLLVVVVVVVGLVGVASGGGATDGSAGPMWLEHLAVVPLAATVALYLGLAVMTAASCRLLALENQSRHVLSWSLALQLADWRLQPAAAVRRFRRKHWRRHCGRLVAALLVVAVVWRHVPLPLLAQSAIGGLGGTMAAVTLMVAAAGGDWELLGGALGSRWCRVVGWLPLVSAVVGLVWSVARSTLAPPPASWHVGGSLYVDISPQSVLHSIQLMGWLLLVWSHRHRHLLWPRMVPAMWLQLCATFVAAALTAGAGPDGDGGVASIGRWMAVWSGATVVLPVLVSLLWHSLSSSSPFPSAGRMSLLAAAAAAAGAAVSGTTLATNHWLVSSWWWWWRLYFTLPDTGAAAPLAVKLVLLLAVLVAMAVTVCVLISQSSQSRLCSALSVVAVAVAAGLVATFVVSIEWRHHTDTETPVAATAAAATATTSSGGGGGGDHDVISCISFHSACYGTVLDSSNQPVIDGATSVESQLFCSRLAGRRVAQWRATVQDVRVTLEDSWPLQLVRQLMPSQWQQVLVCWLNSLQSVWRLFSSGAAAAADGAAAAGAAGADGGAGDGGECERLSGRQLVRCQLQQQLLQHSSVGGKRCDTAALRRPRYSVLVAVSLGMLVGSASVELMVPEVSVAAGDVWEQRVLALRPGDQVVFDGVLWDRLATDRPRLLLSRLDCVRCASIVETPSGGGGADYDDVDDSYRSVPQQKQSAVAAVATLASSWSSLVNFFGAPLLRCDVHSFPLHVTQPAAEEDIHSDRL